MPHDLDSVDILLDGTGYGIPATSLRYGAASVRPGASPVRFRASQFL